MNKWSVFQVKCLVELDIFTSFSDIWAWKFFLFYGKVIQILSNLLLFEQK